MALVPVLAAIVFALACSSSATATPAPSSNQSAIKGAPALALGSLKASLGTVAQDQRQLATFLLINNGSEILKIDQVAIEVAQGADEPSTFNESDEIKPGEAAILPITLGPHKATGPHKLLVKIKSNDPERPVVTASIDFQVASAEAVTGAGPRLAVDKDVIDVGLVPYDWPLYAHFVLSNTGDAPLVLEGDMPVRVEEGC
ncbi:MAG: DUF1573 domain-containing protein [Chloroflexi bacterium]|nr:DUF1573 domain-containing protein [Chloroflexota bacterium]